MPAAKKNPWGHKRTHKHTHPNANDFITILLIYGYAVMDGLDTMQDCLEIDGAMSV